MSIKCKQCGYPVIDAMSSCPNCGMAVKHDNEPDYTEIITCPRCGLSNIDPAMDYCPECGEPLYDDLTDDTPASPAGDVAPQVIPICSLRPLPMPGEGRLAEATFEDHGDGVSLNRANTHPSDASIDDELQAHLFFYKGNWYIEEGVEDRRSTYVHAGQGIKLASGDKIKLGDREFEFNIRTK